MSHPFGAEMDLVTDADDELVHLAEDRSGLPTVDRRTLAKEVESSCQRTAEVSHLGVE